MVTDIQLTRRWPPDWRPARGEPTGRWRQRWLLGDGLEPGEGGAVVRHREVERGGAELVAVGGRLLGRVARLGEGLGVVVAGLLVQLGQLAGAVQLAERHPQHERVAQL